MYSKSFKSQANQQVMKRFIDEVKGLNPSFQAHVKHMSLEVPLLFVIYNWFIL